MNWDVLVGSCLATLIRFFGHMMTVRRVTIASATVLLPTASAIVKIVFERPMSTPTVDI